MSWMWPTECISSRQNSVLGVKRNERGGDVYTSDPFCGYMKNLCHGQVQLMA